MAQVFLNRRGISEPLAPLSATLDPCEQDDKQHPEAK
jgi:hypothetical protein